jgi:hypothetical protein
MRAQYIAAAAVVAVLASVPLARAVRRCLLKRLLKEATNPRASKVVFAALKALSPSAAPTFFFQDVLPPVPVPRLEDTFDRFVRSVASLLPSDSLDALKASLTTFQSSGDASELQRLLLQRARVRRSVLSVSASIRS